MVAVVAVVAGISAGAALADGYAGARVQPDDAAIWVSSAVHQSVARANTLVGELDTAVRMGSSSLTVAQSGRTVVIGDLGAGEARLLDPATAEVLVAAPLPSGTDRVELQGGTIVMSSRSTGDVWAVEVGALASFDATTTPTLALGAGGAASVSEDGSIVAVSPSAGAVYTLPQGSRGVAAGSAAIDLQPDADVEIAAVGESWAVLDRTVPRVLLPNAVAPLDAVDDPATARLQESGESSGAVLVATSSGLLGVGRDGAVERLADGDGPPAAPTWVGGCAYAAWSGSGYWTGCEGEPARSGGLDGLSSSSRLVFDGDGGERLLVSDTVTGRSWDLARAGAVIDDWEPLVAAAADDDAAGTTIADRADELDPDQRPPVAADDRFGARPGRATVLPVLQNDYDPNGDVIVIDAVQVADDADYSVGIVSDRQRLLVTLPSTASGTLALGYTVSDGHGGSASATVSVEVRTDSENSPPVQVRQRTIDVVSGGRAEVSALSDWYDPDGDPIVVRTASAGSPGSIAVGPDGSITVLDPGIETGTSPAVIVVSDGVSDTTGTVWISSTAPEDAPLLAEGFAVAARVGEAVTLSPLAHVTGASGGLRLGSLTAREGAVQPDFLTGTGEFTPASAGTTLLEYSVADGARSASGVIRVVAEPAAEAGAAPVTLPHAAVVRAGGSVDVDVLALDSDPAGGVLLVEGELDVPAPYRAEVLDRRTVRIVLEGPDPEESAGSGRSVVGYRVTNGVASTAGTISVMEVSAGATAPPPVARDDRASVRAGDVVDIPVLANDLHPFGDPLTLDPVLPRSLASDAGLLFVSGDRLRYLAPGTPGDYTALYRVDAPDGQWATGSVTITVREADLDSNSPPRPGGIVARVAAGETVRIPVDLEGVDPDGDSVQFLGADSAPGKGAVTDFGDDWMEYTAGEYSTGTDRFDYAVVDRLGARAVGIARVGIAPRTDDGPGAPVVVADEVSTRPARTVLVPVLANDSDPEGGALSVVGVEPIDPGQSALARVEGDLVAVEVPSAEHRSAFVYTVSDDRGAEATGVLIVDARSDAPLARPVVSDTVVPVEQVMEAEDGVIDVDVLRSVFFAEGEVSRLWLSVDPGSARVARVADGRVRVQVADGQQIIPFTVAHPDDPNVRSSGFVWVPGRADALPQRRVDAPALRVRSGEPLTIELADQIVVAGGGRPVVADRSSVRATHSDGGSLVVDDDTLGFRSADGYFGPASISVEVADGTGGDARVSTIVLGITVTPAVDQPPRFEGAVVELEPGQARTLDLVRLTSTPVGTSPPSGFSLLEPASGGFTAMLVGSRLTLTAADGAGRGDSGSFTIGVSSAASAGRSGRVEVSVVSSTRPKAVAVADTVVAPRGRTTSIDLLANDAAGNPFPATPLRLVAVRGAEAGRLPDGVQVVPRGETGVLDVTVSADAPAADLALHYQVLDATGASDRAVWGSVSVSVQDRPEPVRSVAVTGFGDRTLTVAIAPGAARNSPISVFEVTARTPSGDSVTTECASTVCTVGTPGNGPTAAATVSVSARNAVGLSDPVVYGSAVWSDLLPSVPVALTAAPANGTLLARWSPSTVPAGGSAVQEYTVSVDGRAQSTVPASSCEASGCSTVITGLSNGTSTSIVIGARNGAYPALSSWPTASVTATPYGAPRAGTATAVVDPAGAPGSLTVVWPGFEGNGDPVSGYVVQLLAPGTTAVPGGAQACSVTAPAPGSVVEPVVGSAVLDQRVLGAGAGSAVFTGLDLVGAAYPVVVWGHNRAGCTPSALTTAVVLPRPGPVDTGAVQVDMVVEGTALEPRLVAAPAPSTVPTTRYRVQRVAEDGSPFGPSASLALGELPRLRTGGEFGAPYRFVVQACTTWNGVEACGDPSGPVTAPEPSLTFAPAAGPSFAAGMWRWSGAPDNGDLPAIFTCGPDGATPSRDVVPESLTSTTCTPAGSTGGPPGGDGPAWLLVAVGGRDFVYRDPGD
ncbi:Ig-like domain-containing protein [Herbiconiux moechotypicola]|uniref:Ig-like domain-containing protein n=1 Tax=Herbiconiux moechotypicola TaxID=637393 RepID=A0ABN3D8F7_9MICO